MSWSDSSLRRRSRLRDRRSGYAGNAQARNHWGSRWTAYRDLWGGAANFPEIASFLARLAIDSISVNPSSILRTMAAVWDAETSLEVADAPVSVPTQTIMFQAGAQHAVKDALT